MDRSDQRLEVDRNYDAFQRNLEGYLRDHRGHFALMRDGDVIAFFERPGDAYREGLRCFGDRPFSVQEVTEEPIDLGFYSHVGN